MSDTMWTFQGSIALLSAKTKLLDGGQLDQVEGRLSALTQRLNQIGEKKDSVDDQEKLSKVRGPKTFDIYRQY